jgi:hypothetical protein
VRLVLIAGTSYAALYLILVGQALRGVSLVAPDTTTVTQLGAWVALTIVGAGLAWFGGAGAGRGHAALRG